MGEACFGMLVGTLRLLMGATSSRFKRPIFGSLGKFHLVINCTMTTYVCADGRFHFGSIG